MATWHVTPEYINDQWTEEQFLLLFRMRNRRIRYESGKTKKPSNRILSTQMSDTDFFKATGASITVVTEEKEQHGR